MVVSHARTHAKTIIKNMLELSHLVLKFEIKLKIKVSIWGLFVGIDESFQMRTSFFFMYTHTERLYFSLNFVSFGNLKNCNCNAQ